MCAEHRNLTWTLVLLFLSGALGQGMTVKYQLKDICAVKGSSVVIPCSFFYPNKHEVKEVLWGHEKYNIYNGPFLYNSTLKNTTSRFQYIGDKEHNCSFLIHQIENNDSGKYAFRFITNEDKMTGIDGSMLKVVDLNVSLTKPSGSRSLKEGDSVNLTCANGCDGGHLSSVFTWFKNGEAVHEGPVLTLNNMSSTNSGNYTCSLKTQRATSSEVINIDVGYGPKNTSYTYRILTGDGSSYFKLICTSNAKPPVENYTWFKIHENYHGIIGHQSVISVREGGRYFCSATNKHGSQNSTVNSIEKIKEPFKKVLLLIPALAVLLIVTTVTVIVRLNKKRTRAPETDCEEDTQDTVYVNWPGTDRSQETSQREEATPEVIYTTVDFHTKRQSNTEQQMDSRHDDESVIYSTVCRKQRWSPSYIETL